MEYTTTLVATMSNTPSELFFGRLIKSKLPISEKLLVRKNVKEDVVQEKIENKKENQKYYYDRNAKSLQPLIVGDLVKKNGKEWHYGRIVGVVNDRSYIIKDAFDNNFRRNRKFIAKTRNEEFNASNLVCEANIKSGYLDNLPEIKIAEPFQQKASTEESSDDAPINILKVKVTNHHPNMRLLKVKSRTQILLLRQKCCRILWILTLIERVVVGP